MSGKIPPDQQGRWRDQRGRGSRGPTRVPMHPPMPLPDELPAVAETEEEPVPQKEPAGDGNNGVGGPPPPPPGPRNPPPPTGNPNPPADPPK